MAVVTSDGIMQSDLGSARTLACGDRRPAGRHEGGAPSLDGASFEGAGGVGEGAAPSARGRVRSPSQRHGPGPDLSVPGHFRAVILDMDGVIVDSEPLHERAFYDVLEELGYGRDLGLPFADYVGRSDFELWADFVARRQPAQSLEQLLALKRDRVIAAMRREQPIFAGLPELVERLGARAPLAVASGSDRAVIDAVLALKGLRRFFSVIVSASEVARGKPAPDVFLRTAELLAVPPRDCWVIEDSKPGVAAALAAGMRVIAITNTHPADELRQATQVVRTYAEIERLLLQSR